MKQKTMRERMDSIKEPYSPMRDTPIGTPDYSDLNDTDSLKFVGGVLGLVLLWLAVLGSIAYFLVRLFI